MDYSAAVTAIQQVVTDASPVMLAVLSVTIAIWGFRRVKGLVGR